MFRHFGLSWSNNSGLTFDQRALGSSPGALTKPYHKVGRHRLV